MEYRTVVKHHITHEAVGRKNFWQVFLIWGAFALCRLQE